MEGAITSSATISAMTENQISELLAGFVDPARLGGPQKAQVSAYLEILLRWNQKMNLTALRKPEEIVTRHFGESLFCARHLFPARTEQDSLMDVGSGAGFPGLPMKIWAENLKLALVESNQKKATFLREVVRVLNLTDVSVTSSRAEDLELQARTVTLRAVEHFESIVRTAVQLVGDQGRLALLVGSAQISAAKSLLPELSWSDPVPIPQSATRVLLVGDLDRR
jgi:16S rRNA (guanine527-N7)-methyltransferase